MAALVILARLDGVFFVAGGAITWIAFRWRWIRSRPAPFFLFCAVPFLVLIVYMALNGYRFGLAMPVSGYVKRVARPTVPTPTTIAAWLMLIPLILGSVRVALGHWPRRLADRREAAVVCLTLALLVYLTDTWLVRGKLIPEIWYLAPHLFWAFAVLTLLTERLLRARHRIPARFTTGALCITLAGGIVLTWSIRLQRTSYDHPLAVREAAAWINEHLPEGSILAGWDCGEVAFYADRPVINLDGLVNSAAFLRDYMTPGRTLAFMDEMNVDYVVQHYRARGFAPLGLDPDLYWQKVREPVWSREIEFAPMSVFLRTGRRVVLRYRLEIRPYTAAGSRAHAD